MAIATQMSIFFLMFLKDFLSFFVFEVLIVRKNIKESRLKKYLFSLYFLIKKQRKRVFNKRL